MVLQTHGLGKVRYQYARNYFLFSRSNTHQQFAQLQHVGTKSAAVMLTDRMNILTASAPSLPISAIQGMSSADLQLQICEEIPWFCSSIFTTLLNIYNFALLGRNSIGSGLESREYGRGDMLL
jgi:hypothetical protein